jgi:hypothetical protein
MGPSVRRCVAPTLAAVALGTLAWSAPARAQGWEEETRSLLSRRAGAVVSGAEGTFVETMRGAPDAFVRAQREWFTRVRSLPVGTYRLELSLDEFGDLARASDRARHPAGVHIVQVKERLGFRGYDTRPSNEDLFLTIARQQSGWSVVSDDDLDDLALQSNKALWDFGPVRRLEARGILIVYHPAEQGAVRSILSSAERARARVRRAWPFRWSDPIVIMVPSAVSELERILQTTFDLSTFVAFAASSIDRSEGWSLAGNRVFLHWPNFRKYSAATQQQILAHELTHLATRSITGPFMIAIFDEGVAQHYGEGGGETEQLRRRARAGTLQRRLVSDWFFTSGPPGDIHLAYEEAASFSAFLSRRFGADAPARAYRDLGTIDAVSAGTWRYHLDRTMRALFGRSYSSLESEWAAAVYREYS